MKVFRCLTHSVVLTIDKDSNKRTIESHIRLSSPCYLMTAKEPKEGNQGQCVIEELK